MFFIALKKTKYKSVRWIFPDFNMIFEDSKFEYKTTKFYAKWHVPNFGEKHKLQHLEKFAL